MRQFLLFIFLNLMIGNTFSQVLDDSDPNTRQKILWEGRTLYTQGENRGAFFRFYYAVKNWNNNEQLEHKIQACRSLFTILYVTDSVSKYEDLLKECPNELTDIWFEIEDRNYEPLLKKSILCYPKKALRKKLEGWTIVQFNIEKDGRTSDVQVVESTDKIFNECAIQTAKDYIYLPAIKDGNAIRTQDVKSKSNWDFKE